MHLELSFGAIRSDLHAVRAFGDAGRGEVGRDGRDYGASADKEIVREPVYDVRALDRVVTRVAREIRLLEQALKTTNAKTPIDAYEYDDGALGELS